MKFLLFFVCILCSLQSGYGTKPTSSSSACEIPGETLSTLLHITARLERRVIKEKNTYEKSVVRLRRRACMALHSRRSPFLFVKIFKRSKILLAQLRRRLRYIYLRRRRCAIFVSRLRFMRIIISRNRATLIRAIKRHRSARRHLLRMTRRQRQLKSRQTKKACRFRLARVTSRIQRYRQAIHKLRLHMIRTQNRLVISRKQFFKASRSIVAIRCRRVQRMGPALSKRYRQQIYKMRRIMRRVHRRWLLARRHFVEAMRMAAITKSWVSRCYRTLQKSALRLRRQRRLLCESGHQKFCRLAEIPLRPPRILKLSLAGQCGVGVMIKKPQSVVNAKKVIIPAKPKNGKQKKVIEIKASHKP